MSDEMHQKESPVMVTIHCMTYNHSAYIRQTLDGFVMQKTNFRYEAIVHDDASTDGTAEIVREYAEKYPDIIYPILQTENQYSKADGTIRRTLNANTRGKYIAFCEGDDYWTSPEKLQKQIDFLESHPEYSLCFHKVEELIEGNAYRTPMEKQVEEREYRLHELLFRWVVPSCSMVYRAHLRHKFPENKKFAVGDSVLITTCAVHGKVWCMDDCMGVYRRHSGGWTQKRHHKETSARHARAMVESFPQKEAQEALKILLAIEYHHLKDYCKHSGDKKLFFRLLYMICRDCPLIYLYVHREKTANKAIKTIFGLILKIAHFKSAIEVPRE